MRVACLATAIVLVLSCVPSARAQVESREGIDLQNQILELRQEIQTMQQTLQTGAQPAPSNLGGAAPQPEAPPPESGGPQNDVSAQLVVRVSNLEEQMRTLQGRVDDLANQLQRQNDTLSKQIGDIQFKLGGGAAPAAPGGPAPSPGPDTIPGQAQKATPSLAPPPLPKLVPHRTAELALRDGNVALAKRDYVTAQAAAHEVLTAGRGPRLTDAQLLLARAEAGQQQYRPAAADYFQAYKRAPKSGSAQVALLGVATSLIASNDTVDGCEALAKLKAEFPTLSPGIKPGYAAAHKRAACH